MAFVAPARRPDGERLVLKVSIDDEETRHEPDALALWSGRGAVRLVRSDPLLGAMLLERVEPGIPLERACPRDHAISVACALLRRLRREVPGGHPFLPARTLAERWARELREDHERLGGPIDRALLAETIACCRDLARDSSPTFLVNRDFHLGNILEARREPWLLIDPKPLAGEAAFDTGYFLTTLLPDPPDPSSARLLIRQLASELSLDPERIRAWALVRSVENALRSLGVDRDEGPPESFGRYLSEARALAAT